MKNTVSIHYFKKSSFFSFIHNLIGKIFLIGHDWATELNWNLNFPFYKRQQRYQSHKWNIYSHTRKQNCHKSCKRILDMESQTLTQYRWSLMADTLQNQLTKWNVTHISYSALTNGPQYQTHIRTNWKSAQIALCAHNQASTLDICVRNSWQNAQITLSVHKLTLNGRHMSDQLAKMSK